MKVDGKLNDQLTVFPNPAGTSLTIQVPDDQRFYYLRLINSLGQQVWEQLMQGESSEKIWISKQGLTPGTYWLIGTPYDADGSERQTVRIVITPDSGN